MKLLIVDINIHLRNGDKTIGDILCDTFIYYKKLENL